MNWEAMTVALESLRINTIAGRTHQAKQELLYLLDHLHQIHLDLQRKTVVEDQRKEPRE